MAKIVPRARKDAGEPCVIRRGSSSRVESGDPARGDKKPCTSRNLVTADSAEEAIGLIRRNMQPPVKRIETGRFDMIDPKRRRFIEGAE
jgi:hypothetical protein